MLLLVSFLLLGISVGWSQIVSVKGVVKDSMGEPVIGASVLQKGSTVGTITDLDGNFTLSVPTNATLTISYIGYESQEIALNGRSSLIVTLKDDTQTLDEVVVVGFGTQKKVNLTGSVGIATAKELESRPVMNATQALQGLVPGLQITTNTGELDKDMSINIRGTGTIGDGSSGSPLVLIDGMEGDINTINPQDIESVSVLKDAAASSIYGSRAPFGVILVTTKKGKAGKTVINYNNSFRFSSPINMPEMMDSYTFANFIQQGYTNSGWGTFFSDDVMKQMIDFQAKGGTNAGGLPTDGNVWGKPAGDPYNKGYANTDWYKEIYKDNNFSQEHNLSLTGGTEKINYYASLGYLDQSGTLRHGGDGLKRYNVSGKINAELTSWLDFSYSMRFVRTDNHRPTSFGGGFYEALGRQTWPNLPVYDENGYYYSSPSPAMGLALGGERNVQSDRVSHQGAFIIEPIKNWITNVEFNYSTSTWDVRETSLPYYNHDVKGDIINTNGTSSLYQDHKKENYLNLNIFTSYTHSFNDAHNFKIMGGFQADEMKQSFFSAKRYGLLIEDLAELDLTSNLDGEGKDKAIEAGGYRHEWATAGFFGRLNYDYKGRYLAEVNMRYDGSSRFRSDNRWDLYPSFSLGWNIAREAFWEPLQDVVNTLKLRGSYGELGNQNTTGWYPTYRKMELGSANGDWLQGGLKPNTARVGELISTALTWETVRSWNVGLDWGLFNNRLTGSFDVYTRFTDNMVGPVPELPNVLGIGAPKSNNCDLKNTGWELELAWNDRLRNGLGYGAKLMLSDAKTIIDKYPGNPTNSVWSYCAGREIGEIWGYETVGIAKTQEEMNAHLDKVGGQPFGSEWGAGDIMYKDLDGKPGISEGAGTLEDHGDLKVIGNNTPRYHFGIDLSADWKGFDFRAFFQGVMKRDYWQNSNLFWGIKESEWWSTGLKEHGDYFRGEAIGIDGHLISANTDSYYPRPLFGWGSNGPGKNQKQQTRYLQDASYIRLKNLQIGYTLPTSLTNKLSISKCRIYVSGENLWTGTSLSKLFDPETINGGNTDSNANGAIKSGGNAYPLSRTWSFGISVTL
ncbi:TonB-dependent receptor [Bacteroides sp. 51]|uniref:SusC/RagA family TonB-linked outer membrane protein n=1 Tax=Bacteroides sp. 51 TaxID=2302938 RepID=UPI001EF3B67A|nr:TonB-dependent receptor [Bacteroides sp. 51]